MEPNDITVILWAQSQLEERLIADTIFPLSACTKLSSLWTFILCNGPMSDNIKYTVVYLIVLGPTKLDQVYQIDVDIMLGVGISACVLFWYL